MRKQDLIRAVAQEMQQPESQASTAVNAVLDVIQQSLARGEEVNISGFGAFRVVERAAREGRNPRTGGSMTIGPRKSPAFRAGSSLKRAVEGEEGA
jgi:DNA-binding protein HU-beta